MAADPVMGGSLSTAITAALGSLHLMMTASLAATTAFAYAVIWREGLSETLGVQAGAAVGLVVIAGALGVLTSGRGLTPAALGSHVAVALMLVTVLVWAAARAAALGLEPAGEPLVNLRPAARPTGLVLALTTGAMVLAFASAVLGATLPTQTAGHLDLLRLFRPTELLLLGTVAMLALSGRRQRLAPMAQLGIRVAPGLAVLEVLLWMLSLVLTKPPAWAGVAGLASATLLYAFLLLTLIALAPGGMPARRAVRLPQRGDWRLETAP